jgi:hypothetical protein
MMTNGLAKLCKHAEATVAEKGSIAGLSSLAELVCSEGATTTSRGHSAATHGSQ